MNDTKRYKIYQAEWETWYESKCSRCGKCCGADANDGDPCRNLLKHKDGTYFCKDYPNRLGEQETISGRKFNCVPIREVLKYKYTHEDCSYRKT